MNGFVRLSKLQYEREILERRIASLEKRVLKAENDVLKFEAAFQMLGFKFWEMPGMGPSFEITQRDGSKRVIAKSQYY